jgi:hypothetical protein
MAVPLGIRPGVQPYPGQGIQGIQQAQQIPPGVRQGGQPGQGPQQAQQISPGARPGAQQVGQPSAPTILLMTWNADDLRMCETVVQAQADSARRGLRGLGSSRCIAPSFLSYLGTSILYHQPEVVIVTTPNEADSASFLHSDALPEEMQRLNYQLFRREKIAELGQQLQAPVTGATTPALRISIYLRNTAAVEWQSDQQTLLRTIPNGLQENILQYGKGYTGMITIHLWHRYYGHFAIMAADVPENARPTTVISYTQDRIAASAVSDLSLLTWINEVMSPLITAQAPDHLIIVGSFNYHIVIPDRTTLDTIRLVSQNLSTNELVKLQQFDEGTRARGKDGVLADFQEGVVGQNQAASGPLFAPTWRMTKGRNNACDPEVGNKTSIAPGCFTDNGITGGIGWTDRVFYRATPSSRANYTMVGTIYQRLDDLSMAQSSHAGVLALFELREGSLSFGKAL